AMELYDSQYLLVLAPSLVIVLMFLFFWLFMKETSYDEVLARQKRDHKIPPARPDARKKNDKKKSKKDFDLADAVSPAHEDEEQAAAAPPSSLRDRKRRDKKQQAGPRLGGAPNEPAPVPAPVPAPAPTPVRELNGSKPASRKSEAPSPVTEQPSPPPAEPAAKKKPSQKKQKNETDELPPEIRLDAGPVPVRKEPSPPPPETKLYDGAAPKKKTAPKKQKAEPALVIEPPFQATAYIPLMDNDPAAPQKGPSGDTPAKTNAKKQKNESDKGNSEVRLKELLGGLRSLALSDSDLLSVVNVLRDKCPAALDAWHKSVMKSDPSAQQLQERERLFATVQEEASIAKEKVKQLNQELLAEKQKGMRAEAVWREQRGALEKELGVLQVKAQGSFQEAQATQMKFQQIREQLEGQIARLQQENGILRDAVSTATTQIETKQSAELNKLRSDYGQLVKELTDKTSKLQQEELQRKTLEVNYNQNVSQLEAQLQDAKLRWEEVQGYLHSVNTEHEKLKAAKQELQNKLMALESEINGKNKDIQTLRSNLTDTMVSKDQVEQKMMQLLEASQHSRPDDALQMYLTHLNQYLTNLFIHNSKNVFSIICILQLLTRSNQLLLGVACLACPVLHITFFDLLQENKNLAAQIESLQAQIAAQNSTTSQLEELQKLLAEKETQRKSLEDALNVERSGGASRETDMQVMHNENLSLKADIQKLQAQISEQATSQLVMEQFQKSAQEKEEKIRTVETLLEAGLIQVANKEEELKALRDECVSLKREIEALQQQQTEQTASETLAEELRRTLQEKEGWVRRLEEQLQAQVENVSHKEKTIEALEQQAKVLKAEIEVARKREAEQASTKTQLQELQTLLTAKEEEVHALQRAMEERTREVADREQQQQALQEESSLLRGQVEAQQVLLYISPPRSNTRLKTLLLVAPDQTWFPSDFKKKSSGKLTPALPRSELCLEKEMSIFLFLQQVQASAPSQELLKALAEKEKQVAELQRDLAQMQDSLEVHRKKNNELREKNWSAMEALSATESVLQGKLNKITKESQKVLAEAEARSREVLHRLFPDVPLPHKQNHEEWLQEFEKAAREVMRSAPADGVSKELEEKLRESEETQRILQKDCETYKKVLAETEGILQRLQSSVEQEESRWRVKLEASQSELKQVRAKVAVLERDVDRLSVESMEAENERQHLEAELGKAERESATYVSEVRELKDLLTELQSKLDGSYTEAVRQNEELNLLKTQLNETLSKLEAEESERQKVAGDLYKAQQSLDLIQAEILKETAQVDLIDNSTIETQKETDRKEKMAAGLNQTVMELQQLLQAVNRKLTKGQEWVRQGLGAGEVFFLI
ncbi:KTN1 protein, partial [Atractosteus spatula]|nr:KTN1 protein [Atractosteus spatula]